MLRSRYFLPLRALMLPAQAVLLLCLLVTAHSQAANVRWTGNAQDVKQVSTIAVTGTWATGDTATLTINKKSLIVTIGAAVTTADVAAAIDAAVDATSATAGLVGTESRNVGGQEIPEFAELDASASSSTLTLASATAGVPFTLTRSDTAVTTVNEVQTITAGGTVSGGTFTLTYDGQTTTAIAYNADAATVDAALEALSNIGAGDVTCAGGALPGAAVTVTFTAALAATDVVQLTADGALLTGTSPTIAVATTTQGAAAGALGAVTAVTAATGKNWLSNADNYEGGALPVDNDVLYFDHGAVSVLYGLDYFRTNNIDLDVYVSNDWTGQLGLPPQNVAGYQEYRTPRVFQYRGVAKKCRFISGLLNLSGQGQAWIDFQDSDLNEINVACFRGATSSAPTIFLSGCTAGVAHSSLTITKGAVALEPDASPSDATKTMQVASIFIGAQGGSSDEVFVTIGRNMRLHKCGNLAIRSGTVLSSAGTKSGADECTTVITGGSLELTTGVGQANHTFEVYSTATLYPIGLSNCGVVELSAARTTSAATAVRSSPAT